MKKLYASAIIAVLLAGGVQADLIARWDNDLLAGNNAGPIAANNLGVNVDSAALARGAGATTTSFTNTFAMRNATNTTLAGAIAGSRNFTMTLTAESGYQINLTNVFIRLSAINADPVGRAVFFTLRSDLTGSTDLDTYTVGGTGVTGSSLGPTFNTDLSSYSSLQGISSVTFSLYVWTEWSGKGAFDQVGIGRNNQVNGTDDLVFTGSVVPEPATFAFMGLGALVLFVRRRLLK
ncbi:MAG TPA: PEP-CTERM sorting domain-containing protein [Kiritimatiellia bacterium]|nr:PEP-CTERM sorting domain-containing protein [Kiritimatiellia bacterium]